MSSKWRASIILSSKEELADLMVHLMGTKFAIEAVTPISGDAAKSMAIMDNARKPAPNGHKKMGMQAHVIQEMAKHADQSFTSADITAYANQGGWPGDRGSVTGMIHRLIGRKWIVRVKAGKYRLTKAGREIAVNMKETGAIKFTRDL